MAENDVCLSEQEDEILALSSIFGDEFSRNEYEECSTIYEIKIPINLPEKRVQLQAWLPVGEEEEEAGDEESRHGDENNNGEEEVRETLFPSKKIQFRRSESKRHSCLALSLSHLAPLRLEFSFPKDYPSSSKPLFTLSCLWLDKYHLGCLCRQLDEQWESSFKGQAVVFPWVDWLQNSSLEFLGFSQAIFLKPFEWGMDCECDPRGIPEFLEPKTCALKMLEYDFQMQQREFQKESHVCEICFEEHEGILFHFLPECGHKFCVECLLDYCQMHVNEGTVRLLKCPERECKSALSPIILRELLNDEDFERWERLLFQQTLDSMVDILYCPRCNSVVVQDEDKESKLAQCGECFFSFCTECLLSWHSAQPCGNEDVLQKASKSREKRQKLKPKSKYQTTQEADKLVSAHPKSAMMKSYDFLLLQKRLGNYQRCPKCRIMVEKTQGCNMMHCSRCGQKFCWSCGNKVGGYEHFSTCNNAGNNIHDRGRQMLANRPVAGALLRMNELQTVNPGVAMKLQVCPQCRQRNMKEFRNNHMKCWACRTDFCYHCGKKTGNPVSSHFKVSGTCKQHSDD